MILTGWAGKESTAYDINAGSAPVATDVAIDNTSPAVGDNLNGSYTYGDADGDAEGASTFQWYRAGVAIAGATGQSYTLVVDDEGKALSFGVTPVAATGSPAAGTEAKSAETSVVTGSAPFVNVFVNGETFAVDSGFPTTGYVGASFNLTTTSGSATDYNWSSSAAWVQVDGATGKVSFTSVGNTSPVTITATPIGGGNSQAYTFVVSEWYSPDTLIKNYEAAAYCTSLGEL